MKLKVQRCSNGARDEKIRGRSQILTGGCRRQLGVSAPSSLLNCDVGVTIQQFESETSKAANYTTDSILRGEHTMTSRCTAIAAIFFSLVVPTLSSSPANAQNASITPDPVGDYVRSEMQKQRIPGLSLLLSKGGQIVRAEGFGLANVELQVPVRPETVFQSGSVGKQFTATAVMMLVEEGKVGLDDSITKYFPEAPASWKPVTIRHEKAALIDCSETRLSCDVPDTRSEKTNRPGDWQPLPSASARAVVFQRCPSTERSAEPPLPSARQARFSVRLAW